MSAAASFLPMNILVVTDAWLPQVNAVVTTLVELVRQLQAMGHAATVIQPGQFRTRPCPGHPGIDLALFPGRRLTRLMDEAQPSGPSVAMCTMSGRRRIHSACSARCAGRPTRSCG